MATGLNRMVPLYSPLIGVYCCGVMISVQGFAQEAPVPAIQPHQSTNILFGDEDLLELTLTADLRAVFRDVGDDRPYREATLSYRDDDSSVVSLDMRVRTRGHFRLLQLNCQVPPLRLNFKESYTEHTFFARQGNLKLVTHCRNTNAYEQRILQEYLIYKVYNVLTDVSFRVRLVHMTYLDTLGKRKPLTRYGFLIEHDDQMATRNGSVVLESQRVHPEATQHELVTLLAVFQFMIGNTDWGIMSKHNIVTIFSERLASLIAVPYDFDWAGLIDAPYANPDPKLNLRSVRDRRFMGFCRTEEEFAAIFAQFNEKKETIYTLFQDVAPLDPKFAKRSIQYLDEFYEIINEPADLRWAFLNTCLEMH